MRETEVTLSPGEALCFSAAVQLTFVRTNGDEGVFVVEKRASPTPAVPTPNTPPAPRGRYPPER